ncbi:hypothetical protein AGMMS50268_31000 [Spirochaetia bacterium]|nr:hypothetical protein AGMMS50268_31000 [Spirochaetia bacterium]
MKITKEQLCPSCRTLRHRNDDGSLGLSIEEWLDCNGYNMPNGHILLNSRILWYLEEDGGCERCKSLFRS